MLNHRDIFEKFALHKQWLNEGKPESGRFVVITNEQFFHLQYQTLIEAAIAGMTLGEIQTQLDRYVTFNLHQRLYDRFLIEPNYHDQEGFIKAKNELLKRKSIQDILELLETKQKQLEARIAQCKQSVHFPPFLEVKKAASPVKSAAKKEFKACEVCDENIMQTKHEQSILEDILFVKIKEPHHAALLPFGIFCHLAEKINWDEKLISPCQSQQVVLEPKTVGSLRGHVT